MSYSKEVYHKPTDIFNIKDLTVNSLNKSAIFLDRFNSSKYSNLRERIRIEKKLLEESPYLKGEKSEEFVSPEVYIRTESLQRLSTKESKVFEDKKPEIKIGENNNEFDNELRNESRSELRASSVKMRTRSLSRASLASRVIRDELVCNNCVNDNLVQMKKKLNKTFDENVENPITHNERMKMMLKNKIDTRIRNRSVLSDLASQKVLNYTEKERLIAATEKKSFFLYDTRDHVKDKAIKKINFREAIKFSVIQNYPTESKPKVSDYYEKCVSEKQPSIFNKLEQFKNKYLPPVAVVTDTLKCQMVQKQMEKERCKQLDRLMVEDIVNKDQEMEKKEKIDQIQKQCKMKEEYKKLNIKIMENKKRSQSVQRHQIISDEQERIFNSNVREERESKETKEKEGRERRELMFILENQIKQKRDKEDKEKSLNRSAYISFKEESMEPCLMASLKKSCDCCQRKFPDSFLSKKNKLTFIKNSVKESKS